MSLEEIKSVEVIERWERKEDGTTEISYSYDSGVTWRNKGEVYELSTAPNQPTKDNKEQL